MDSERINAESRRNLRSVTDEELRAAAMGTMLGLDESVRPAFTGPFQRGEQPTRVYFVRMHVEDGPIKIGLSWNTYQRYSNLLTASPYELTYMGDMPGDKEVEHSIHERFAHLRIRGEWFRPAPELLDFIVGSVVHR